MSTAAAIIRNPRTATNAYAAEPVFVVDHMFGLPIMFDGAFHRYFVTDANGTRYFAQSPSQLKAIMKAHGRRALTTKAPYVPRRVALG